MGNYFFRRVQPEILPIQNAHNAQLEEKIHVGGDIMVKQGNIPNEVIEQNFFHILEQYKAINPSVFSQVVQGFEGAKQKFAQKYDSFNENFIATIGIIGYIFFSFVFIFIGFYHNWPKFLSIGFSMIAI